MIGHKSGKTSLKRKSQQTLLFLAPWILTFLIFWLYPLIFSFILSFCDYDIFHPETMRFSGFQNYFRLFSDERFVQGFKNTVFFVFGTTPVITMLSLCLALLLNNIKIGLGFFRSAFFLPSIISIIVVSTIFKFFYSPDGSLNSLMSFFGITSHAWLVETKFAMPAIMAMNIWASIGYYMVLFLAALKAIPVQLYESADVDGAGELQKFRYITLPMIKPMILFVVVINTIRSWQVFPEVFTLTRGGPLGTTDTIVHRLYETAFRFHEMGYSSAMAYLLFAIILGFSLLQMKLLETQK